MWLYHDTTVSLLDGYEWILLGFPLSVKEEKERTSILLQMHLFRNKGWTFPSQHHNTDSPYHYVILLKPYCSYIFTIIITLFAFQLAFIYW